MQVSVRRLGQQVALCLLVGACAGAPVGTPSCTAASISDVEAAMEGIEPPPERSVAPLVAGGAGVVGAGAVALMLWHRRRT